MSPETDHDVALWLDTFHRLQDMLQAAATSCFREGKINQGHEYKQQKYFMSGEKVSYREMIPESDRELYKRAIESRIDY